MAPLDRSRPSIDPDKSGDAFNVQRFQMLEDIPRELARNVTFPTSFYVACKLRKTLQDRKRTLDDIVHVLALEPLISAKLIQLANTPRYNHNGKRHVDLQSAVSGLGIETVRSTALAIVMAQCRHGHAGVHDSRPGRVLHALPRSPVRRTSSSSRHHQAPEEIIHATEDHDRKTILWNPPRTLADIVHIANMLAGSNSAWLHQGRTAHDHAKAQAVAAFEHLIPEIDALAEKMRNDLT